MTFLQKLEESLQQAKSCLCIGLDPDLRRIPSSIKKKYSDPPEQVFQFLKTVIRVTCDSAAAYKPNLGFFEALGPQGLYVFQEILKIIPEKKIIIADAKRGDISSTAEHYAQAYFEQFDVDSITINPLMGFETLDPFLAYPEKGVYVLTLTSNPGASDFLSRPFGEYQSMAEYISTNLAKHNKECATHLGMVIGATQPDRFSSVVQHHSAASLLIPGVGTQGGSTKKLSHVLKNHKGIPLINSSRSILYAGENASDWERAVANKTIQFKKTLQPITEYYV